MRAQTIETIDDLPYNLDKAEKLLVERALEKTEGNISQAAKLLGGHRVKVYRILARGEQIK